MPKRRPSRRQRSRQPAAKPRPAPPPRQRAVARPIAVAEDTSAKPATEAPSSAALLGRDYSYVNREVVRILILAAVILVTLIVLSFFLP